MAAEQVFMALVTRHDKNDIQRVVNSGINDYAKLLENIASDIYDSCIQDYYAKYNAQLSEVGIDGHKTVREKGWFKRGTLVVVNGFRRGNTFVAKRYKKTESHQLYIIDKIYPSGLMDIRNSRWGENNE